MRLHPEVSARIQAQGVDPIDRIVIETQEAGRRIIDKTGPLANYADRDHCIQYMVAVPLLFGRLTADDYGDAVAAEPRIDLLRARTLVVENPDFTRDYFDPDKRYIGNAVQVFFADGTATEKVSIDYPVGHRRRRSEGIPLLMSKFERAITPRLPALQAEMLLSLCREPERFDRMAVTRLMAMLQG